VSARSRGGRAARQVIRLAALLVPVEVRPDWLEEWQAELDSRAHESGGRLLRRSLGAFADAAALRRESLTVRGLGGDIRRTWRGLRRSPAFTVTGVATIALGVGALTALFAVVDAVLIRPLPFPQSERLVRVDGITPAGFPLPLSRPDWRDFSERQTSFTGMASHLPVTTETVLGGSTPARLRVERVSGNFFEVLGVPPVRGRTFVPSEDGAGAAPIAVLSHGTWQRLFAGRSDLESIALDLLGAPHSVVGVMPAGFQLTQPADVWVLHERERIWEVRAWPTFATFARLRDGVSLPAAQAQMQAIAEAGRAEHDENTMAVGARLLPLREWLVSGVRGTLLVLLGAAAFVLLVACANMAGALLARGRSRSREIAVRLALGATRSRVVRELLVESAVLAGIGCALGLILAEAGLVLVRTLGSGMVPRLAEVRLGPGTIAFAVLAAGMTVPLFGLPPALAAARGHIGSRLRRATRDRFAWSVLIACELAMATALLIGAGLLVRSVAGIRGAPLGWDPRDLLLVEVAWPPSRYPDADARVLWTTSLEEQLATIPGVQAVGATTRLPLDNLEDQAPAYTPEEGFTNAGFGGYRVVSNGYFAAMRIPLRRGRNFDGRDVAGGVDVAIVTENLARKLWRDEDPIGRRVRHNNDFGGSNPDPYLTVIGVVGEVRHWASAQRSQAELFVPVAQRGLRAATMIWTLRTGENPAAVAGAIRDRIEALDAAVPFTLRTMDDRLAATYRDRRFSLGLLGVFGATAVVLAMIGIAGVVAYGVERRRREIGVRLALGARHARVRREIQQEMLRPAVVGVALGAAAALVLARALGSLLYGVGTNDPLTFIVVPLVAFAAAWLAGLIPTRRALRIQPISVLRSD
jgi:putative ABC transport system permease protein